MGRVVLKNPKMYVGIKGRKGVCACRKEQLRLDRPGFLFFFSFFFLTTELSLRENRKIPFLASRCSSPVAAWYQYAAASLT